MCKEEKGSVTFNVNCCGEGSNNGSAATAPSIGSNGNWFIGDEDTGVAAQGPKGDTGAQGPVGPQGLNGKDGENADMSRLEALEDKVNGLDGGNLKDYLIVMEKTMSEPVTIEVNRSLQSNIDITPPSGYKVLFAMPREAGHQHCFMNVINFTNSFAGFTIRNPMQGSITITPSVFVVYVKEL